MKDREKCHCLVTPTIAPLFWLVSTKLEEHERDIFRWGELKNIPVVVPRVLQITHQRDPLAFTAAKEQKNVHPIPLSVVLCSF